MTEETVIEFPCKFPIKMMGRDTAQFRVTAQALVETHTGPIADDAVRTSASNNGNFVSVTVTITATSQQQLDDIYRDVSAHAEVLVAL